MAQQLDSVHDAILAKGKSTNAMIAGGTEPAGALIALDHRWIL